jgi:hypothetical protein
MVVDDDFAHPEASAAMRRRRKRRERDEGRPFIAAKISES